jgi:hypothetical protein
LFSVVEERAAAYSRRMIRVEPVGHIRSQWGEGPIWFGTHLYYVDIEGRMVHRYNPEDGSEKSWPVGERVGVHLFGFELSEHESVDRVAAPRPKGNKVTATFFTFLEVSTLSMIIERSVTLGARLPFLSNFILEIFTLVAVVITNTSN